MIRSSIRNMASRADSARRLEFAFYGRDTYMNLCRLRLAIKSFVFALSYLSCFETRDAWKTKRECFENDWDGGVCSAYSAAMIVAWPNLAHLAMFNVPYQLSTSQWQFIAQSQVCGVCGPLDLRLGPWSRTTFVPSVRGKHESCRGRESPIRPFWKACFYSLKECVWVYYAILSYWITSCLELSRYFETSVECGSKIWICRDFADLCRSRLPRHAADSSWKVMPDTGFDNGIFNVFYMVLLCRAWNTW